MARLLIPPGLRRDGEGIYRGRAELVARSKRAPPTVHECSDEDAVELEWGDGTCIIRRATDLAETLETPDHDIDLGLASSRGLTRTRDGVISALTSVVIHSAAADVVVHDLAVKLDQERLRAGRPPAAAAAPHEEIAPRLWAIDAHGVLSKPVFHDVPNKVTVDRVKEGGAGGAGGAVTTILVLIHGTFSNTRDAYADLFQSAIWSGISEGYCDPDGKIPDKETAPARCFGFDHRTVSEDPIDNARQLLDALPHDVELDIIAHSRGGLVADIIATAARREDVEVFPNAVDLGNALKELRATAAAKNITVRRTVRVAAPARGTTLASARLDTWLNVILNVVGLMVGALSGDLYDGLKELLLGIVRKRADKDVTPGLAVMIPDSDLVKWLPSCAASDVLTVIAGDASRPDFLGRLRTLLVDLFFLEKNDLVVDTAAMVGGATRAEWTLRAFRDTPEAPLHHLSYFANREVQVAINDALFPTGIARSVPSPSTLRDWPHALSDFTVGDGAPAPRPICSTTESTVIVVPGIMGTLLSDHESVIWPKLSQIVRGRFTRLDLRPPNNVAPVQVSTGNILSGPYARLLMHLAAAHRPQTFPYDWRLSIQDSAAKLAEVIKESLKTKEKEIVRIIAHSLGGLVVLGVACWHRPVWDALCKRGGRALLLGTPLRGSWSIVNLLRERDALIRQLALADVVHTSSELVDVVRRFPSVLELLPADNVGPEPPNEVELPLSSDIWRDALGIAAADLKAARSVRQELAATLAHVASQPEKPLVYIAGRGNTPTLCGGVTGPDPFDMWQTREGDGTVTWQSAIDAKLPAWLLEADHGSLADTPSAFDAFTDLLALGSTRALRRLDDDVVGSVGRTTNGASLATTTRLGSDLRDMTAPRKKGTKPAAPVVSGVTAVAPPVLVPTESELVDAAIGRTSAAAPSRVLQIEVVHGDLAAENGLVVVAHASGEVLRGAEPSLDIVFGGALSERLRSARYPGVLGTCVAIPWLGPRSTTRPTGVLVVGLGEIAELTRARLTDAMRGALIDLSLPPSSSLFPDEVARSLSLSLMGYRSNGGGLTAAESVASCLDAIVLANRDLARRGLADRCVRRVRFVNVYAQVAEDIVHMCQDYARRPGVEQGDRNDEPLIPPRLVERPSQWLPLRSMRVRPPGRLRRITITAEGETPHCAVMFGVAGDGALFDREKHEVSWGTLDNACATLLESAMFPARAAQSLRDHVLPFSLHEEWMSGCDLQLVVDERTASIPWEVFVAAGVDDVLPLTASVSILRQLTVARRTIVRSNRGDGCALVLCAPGVGATPLPAAGKEADEVQTLLSRHGFRVDSARTGDEIRESLSGHYEIVHITGHGQHIRKTPSRTGALLRVANGVNAEDILSVFDMRAFMRTPPALVFLNCCHLARIDQALTLDAPSEWASGLAQELIKMGVQTVVAAGWAVADEAARMFAATLYTELLSGLPLRLALANARVAAREQERTLATWAAYQVYGSPDFVLPSVRARASELDADLETLLKRTNIVSDQEALDVLGEVFRRLNLGGGHGPTTTALRSRPREFVEALPDGVRTQAVVDRLEAIMSTIHRRFTNGATPPAAQQLAVPAVVSPQPQTPQPPPQEPARALKNVPSMSGEGAEPPATGPVSVTRDPIFSEIQRTMPRSAGPAVANAAEKMLAFARDETEARVTAHEVALVWRALVGGLRPDLRTTIKGWIWNVLYWLRDHKDKDPLAPKPNPEFARLLQALQEAIPDTLDDPNAGRFGFLPKRELYTLTGNIVSVRGLYRVELFVDIDSVDEADMPECICLYLHPSFGEHRDVRPTPATMKREANHTRLTVSQAVCYGAFTVGVELFRKDGRSIRLELDLAYAHMPDTLRKTFIADGLR